MCRWSTGAHTAQVSEYLRAARVVSPAGVLAGAQVCPRRGHRAELCGRTCRASGPTPRRRPATWRQTRQRQPRQPAAHAAAFPRRATKQASRCRIARLCVASARATARARAGSHAANAGLCIGLSEAGCRELSRTHGACGQRRVGRAVGGGAVDEHLVRDAVWSRHELLR